MNWMSGYLKDSRNPDIARIMFKLSSLFRLKEEYFLFFVSNCSDKD